MENTNLKQNYEIKKKNLLNDKSICKENRNLFDEFFTFQERKLKRINGLSSLDDGTYRTLYKYVHILRNVNSWFKNKAWKKLTKEDIRKVYDDLEDGVITRIDGKPIKDKATYYNKVFKSKPFKLAGKDEIARELIEVNRNGHQEVRFITEQDFRELVNNTHKIDQKLLLWLSFDLGENINSLLRLKKSDFHKQINEYTKEPEYRVNLRKDILKRSRTSRSDLTIYPETINLLDKYLSGLKDDDLLFNYKYRNAKKFFDNIVLRSKVKCIPNNEKPTWKDLRSSMACDLLKKGWTTDEVNARLGHKPSSDEINKYVNFLAIDKSTPKKKIHQFEMSKIQEEFKEERDKQKLKEQRFSSEIEELKLQLNSMNQVFSKLKKNPDLLKKLYKKSKK